MDTVTQQDAANSEESSSAAAELSGQSEELAAMVQTFQLDRMASGPSRPVVAHRVAARPPVKALSPSAPAKRNGQTGIVLRPEEIIPLDGDPQFKEF